MVRQILVGFCLVVVTTTVQSQYFDLYSALQPFLQFSTSRPSYEHTTKRKSHSRTTHSPKIESQNYFNYDTNYNINSNRQTPIPGAIVFEQDTTVRSRKTTKSNRRNESSSRDTRPIDPIENIWNYENNNDKSKSKQDNKGRNDSRPKTDRFDTGRNTVYNYETTKPYVFATKSPFNDDKRTTKSYTTHNPLINRPGVRPVVTHGPPITNRPATQKPGDGGNYDNITPELIIGPDEDYLSAAEKKRYIDITEKMCEKYKLLNIKQLEAIPLLPSPDPVRVNVSLCAPTTIPLVVGGKVVQIDEFPHMALLGWRRVDGNSYSWKCGGSLVSNQHILTAAHCAYQDRDNDVISGPPSLVQLGSSFLNDNQGKLVKVAAVIRHPKYKQPKSYYDIAIVKLVTPVTFSDVIKPACLGSPPEINQSIIATGWGRTEFGGDQSRELRSVSIPVWGYSECSEALGTSRRLPDGPSPDSQICAGERRGGKDTCQGDSGGPAQLQDGCMWRVVAVTSLGRSCGAPNTPALYATVPKAFVAAVAFEDKIKNTQTITNRQDDRDEGRQTYDQTDYYNQNNQGNNRNQDNYNKNDQKIQKNVGNSYNNQDNQNNQRNSGNEYYSSSTENYYYSQNNQGNNNRNNQNEYYNQNNQGNVDQYYNQGQASTNYYDKGNNNNRRNNNDYTSNSNQAQANNYNNNNQNNQNYNYDQISNNHRNNEYSSNNYNNMYYNEYTTQRYNPQNYYNFGEYNYNPGSWWT